MNSEHIQCFINCCELCANEFNSAKYDIRLVVNIAVNVCGSKRKYRRKGRNKQDSISIFFFYLYFVNRIQFSGLTAIALHF